MDDNDSFNAYYSMERTTQESALKYNEKYQKASTT